MIHISSHNFFYPLYLLLFSGNIKESYLVNPSPPSTLQKAQRRKWFKEKYSSKNNKHYKNKQDVGIPYPFRKPKKHAQTGTGTRSETGAKIKSSFGSQQITHSELKFRKMSIFVEQKRIFFTFQKVHIFCHFKNGGNLFLHTKEV